MSNVSTATHTDSLFAGLSGRYWLPSGPLAPNLPLVVAIHGGTYTSFYFDVPGASLFEQAAANGIPLIAPDRSGYVKSPLLPPEDATVVGQGRFLAKVLNEAWKRYGAGTKGIVLIGHSIGGAIAAVIAGEPCNFPLIGVALSGVCLHTPTDDVERWKNLPDIPIVEIPAEVKEIVMFGPEGSFAPGMPKLSTRVSGSAAPKVELVDIVSTWYQIAPDVLKKIKAPVHYRQAEIDRLWICGQEEVDGFARALSNAARVDSAMMHGTGHCIDFHHVGRALQLQQLAFALQCAAEAP